MTSSTTLSDKKLSSLIRVKIFEIDSFSNRQIYTAVASLSFLSDSQRAIQGGRKVSEREPRQPVCSLQLYPIAIGCHRRRVGELQQKNVSWPAVVAGTL